MTREQVYAEMTGMLGSVPSFFKTVPDHSIGLEWDLMKTVQMGETAIPNKYKELIGVACAAMTRCKYCAYFHASMARLFGATDAEIEDAVHYAKMSAGWSTYINGMQTDFDQFKTEIDKACAHVAQMMAAG